MSSLLRQIIWDTKLYYSRRVIASRPIICTAMLYNQRASVNVGVEVSLILCGI